MKIFLTLGAITLSCAQVQAMNSDLNPLFSEAIAVTTWELNKCLAQGFAERDKEFKKKLERARAQAARDERNRLSAVSPQRAKAASVLASFKK